MNIELQSLYRAQFPCARIVITAYASQGCWRVRTHVFINFKAQYKCKNYDCRIVKIPIYILVDKNFRSVYAW